MIVLLCEYNTMLHKYNSARVGGFNEGGGRGEKEKVVVLTNHTLTKFL